MADLQPLSEQEFWDIYQRVPRLTVEVVILDEARVLLTKRAVEPCRGLWHIPGGTVRFGESLIDAVLRVALDEVDLDVRSAELLGYIEYPSHYQHGLDHPVGIAFRAIEWSGEVRLDSSASEYGWFGSAPSPMHDEQREFLAAHM